LSVYLPRNDYQDHHQERIISLERQSPKEKLPLLSLSSPLRNVSQNALLILNTTTTHNTSSHHLSLLPPREGKKNATKYPHYHQHYPQNVNNISIVVQLSGELGNHLSKVAFGYSIQQLLMERHGIPSHLVLQHQERGSKWETARRDLQQCFPFFRRLDFELGNSPEFYNLQHRQQQQSQLEEFDHQAFVFPMMSTMDDIHSKLETIAEVSNRTRNERNVTTGNISFPFLHVQDFAEFPLIDRYYDQLRELFEFDHAACCAELPYEDEAVFVSVYIIWAE
jgi:hypothetical protein